PSDNELSTLAFVFQEPPVTSGISIGALRFATDHSLNGLTTLHAAASYTSISIGSPFRKQSINRQSIIKSIPPCPPTCLAKSPIFLTIGGVYCSSIFFISFSSNQPVWLVEIRPGKGYF